jgi:UPF0755 protein
MRRRAIVMAGLGAVLVVAGLLGLWVQRQIDPPGQAGEEVRVSIPNGSSPRRIGAILDDHGVIANPRVFELYVKVTGAGPFHAGSYRFRQRSDLGSVIDVFASGPTATRLTIPEGFTLAQIAERVGQLPGRSAERFMALARSGTIRSRFQPEGSKTIEGLLFPETYEFEDGEDEEVILKTMVRQFDREAAELGLEKGRAGLDPYKVVIVASLVEREAQVSEERGKIARVMYNRLAIGERLGIDAAVRYGLNKPVGPLTKSDLASKSPYNLRLRRGLPPTPIASPGKASLEAALRPTPGEWLFFVIADRSGRHNFAATLFEHNRHKARAKAKGLL